MLDENLTAFLHPFDDENLPDGAWWAKLEDGVKEYNEVNNRNLDLHDTISEYVAEQASLVELYGGTINVEDVKALIASCLLGKKREELTQDDIDDIQVFEYRKEEVDNDV